MTDHAIYDYIPHIRTKAKLDGSLDRPVTVAGQLPTGNVAARFNAWFAVKVTNGVGTMWCAYAFAALALISLPQAISSHSADAGVLGVPDLPSVGPVVGHHRRSECACRSRRQAL